MSVRASPTRAVLDASAILSGRLPELVAAAILGFYDAYWSSWIVAEVVRKRTEWIALGEVREGILLLGSRTFLNRMYDDDPQMVGLVQEFLGREESPR